MKYVPLNRCWYRTTIDVTNALQKKEFPFYNPEEKILIWQFHADEILEDDWLYYMKSIRLPVKSVMVFYRPAGTLPNLHAHIDKFSSNSTMSFALNWVIGGKDSEMIWYKTPNNVYTKSDQITMAGTKYLEWAVTELEEIDRTKIESELTLTRVDVPHGITMCHSPRLCISLRTVNSAIMQWENVVTYMKIKGLLIDEVVI